MVQLEINLCFFAFYELVPDEEEEGGKITQWVWGGAETIAILEVSISRLRNNMVHNQTESDLSALSLDPASEYWTAIGHTGPICLCTAHSAPQTMNNQLCTRARRSPHTSLPFPSISRAFCSDCEH